MATTLKHSSNKPPPLKRRKLNTTSSRSNLKKSAHKKQLSIQKWTPQSPSPSPPPIINQIYINNNDIDIQIEIEICNTNNSHLSDNEDNNSELSCFADTDTPTHMDIDIAIDTQAQSPSPPWGRSPSPPPIQYFHKPTKKKSRWDEKNESLARKQTSQNSINLQQQKLITAGVNSLIHSINLQQQKQQKIEPLLLDEHGNPLTNNIEIMDDEYFEDDIQNDTTDEEEFYDDTIFNKPPQRINRQNAFKFIEQGAYTAKANNIRAKELANSRNKPRRLDISTVVKKLHDDEGLEWLDYVPNVEWWDNVLLTDKNEYNSPYKKEMITDLIENPKILRPELLTDNNQKMNENLTGMSWILTKKERKKIKRMKKKEEHQLRTDEIRLGLREPPEPRLKLSNIITVLGSSAIRDPTAAESIARAQMWKRKVKHELHNATNQLNPQQKREKKRKKLQEDTSKEVYVNIFVIYNLYGKLNKTKICLNAQQRNLTGGLIMLNNKDVIVDDENVLKNEEDKIKIEKKENEYDDNGLSLNMVIVEGGPKGISKYQRLLMHRIKWGNFMIGGDDDDDNNKKKKKKNICNDIGRKNCAKIWEGTVAKRSFQTFHQKRMKNENDLKEFLKMHNVLSYWDMVKNSSAVTSNVLCC